MKLYVMLLACSVSFAYGGFEEQNVGARGRGMGGAATALSGDVLSAIVNPATLTALSPTVCSFDYVPSPFGLKELSSGAVAVVVPTRVGAFGAAGCSYGFDLYKEVSASLSYATVISKVSLGFTLTYDHVTIRHYGSAGAFMMSTGLFMNITSQFRAGLAMHNPGASVIGSSQESLPQRFSAGLCYMPLPDLNLALDYEKEIGFDPSPRFGFEYHIVQSFFLRGGISEEPSLLSGGIGITFGPMQFDYALSSHQELGWTQEISLSISPGGTP